MKSFPLLIGILAALSAPALSKENAQKDPVKPAHVPPNGPIQPGAPIHDCYYWFTAQKGSTCWSIAKQQGIKAQRFVAMNPQLHNNCPKNFQVGKAYCLARTPEEMPAHGVYFNY
ncbi:hypothetical protein F5Y15DRAFT_200412 [Xylariaceae sp. FL0016]|nr:hypothetical protein F5Y15DRAFT_200412 [Xylariaceae sp. FL0016]